MTIKPQELYKTEDLAEALKVSVVTAKRYLAGDVVSSIKVGGSRRIRGADIINLLEKNASGAKGGCELIYPNKKPASSILGGDCAGSFEKSSCPRSRGKQVDFGRQLERVEGVVR